jgi:cytochrome c peroxidase
MYVTDLGHVGDEIDKLVIVSNSYLEGEEQIEAVQSQVLQTRLSFKRVEFLLDYFDSDLVGKFINGAPLPKVEPNVPEIVVLEPKGLQTLDELAFLAPEEADQIAKLAGELQATWKKTQTYQGGQNFEHRYLLEAIRYGILRIFTLGLTGFDTPGSGNAMAESLAAWERIGDYLSLYAKIVSDESASILESLEIKMKEGRRLLRSNQDFDTFDRATFLREVTQPLYQDLLGFHKRSGVELRHEVDPTLYAHNYESSDIFSEDFLNSGFYTQVAQSDLEDPKKIELGKYLFFDPIMSRELTMSCASCHHPDKAFTDGEALSRANRSEATTRRNSMTLVNAVYYGQYFWDMREYDLERQIKHVVHDNLEFDLDFLEIADRLKESEEYTELFREAYGDRDKYGISSWSISNSLAAYINSLQGFNSPFDQYVRSEIEEISAEVIAGFNLFMGKAACGTCHFAPAFNGTVPPYYQDSESEVLGVTVSFDTINPQLDQDPGRIANGLPRDAADHLLRSMKTVTIRNAALTGPYMHNGGFSTLEEVVHFYNKGGGAGLGLDVPYQTLPPDHLGLTNTEVGQLVAFMDALTDTTGMSSVPTRLPEFNAGSAWAKRSINY